jgi:ABC-2 type transport system permease protein
MKSATQEDALQGRLDLYDDTSSGLDGKQQSETSPQLLVRQSWLQTRGLLIRWRHDAQTVIEALVLPSMLLVAVNLVFGKPVFDREWNQRALRQRSDDRSHGSDFRINCSGSESHARARAGAADATLGSADPSCVGPALTADSRGGADCRHRRRRAVHRVRVGFPVQAGNRRSGGMGGGAGDLRCGLCILVTTTALYLANTVLAEATGMVVSLLFFFCTGFVPRAQYPSWIRPVVEHQPMSYAVEAMRGLAFGGPVVTPIVGTLLWSAGIVAVCTTPMVIGYRKASMR